MQHNNVTPLPTTTDWLAEARYLGPAFADRAYDHDRDGTFVSDNYADLREAALFSAGIPGELGGGGASHAELCGVIRELGRHCGSTALAFAMHSHPVAANVFKHLRGDEKATATLRKIAAHGLVIAGTGANDWLGSNGTAEAVEGGYRVTAHKRFVSGCPGADVFVTSAVHESNDGAEVLHFAVPFKSDGITIVETWDTLGMRGTGSNDVTMAAVFVAEEAIIARRPAGSWHPMWNVIIPIALPLITSCYVGLAEAAADMATASAKGKPYLAKPLGELHNELTTAQLALDDMIRITDNYRFTPSVANADAILTRKSLAARAVKSTVEKAAELVGGPGFFKAHALERIVRDIRAMHFHPLPEARQQIFSGRVALELDPVEA